MRTFRSGIGDARHSGRGKLVLHVEIPVLHVARGDIGAQGIGRGRGGNTVGKRVIDPRQRCCSRERQLQIEVRRIEVQR